ncbi:helix-turn-helix transcriptional regulator [Streptomyces sp. Li-HN-5-11]|uniref:helix-turn-helix domain-containing protein n=1 Tax=Streptomyces sp. Li-HN-5-11 TaxID=3075432 RepID=UPI0028B0CA4F|nr:helix-turn-helix transcriptional regulator [Streptomyces sp. Li-HN-5-11]WNM31697.1 helix-turn-helix transcriptional regulator [Streptomyces sp. Li-HN-5-11]WNM31960.1 helix-turn-helix transcriptional regulator [Streptomyces sp. Li-HN-5-11]
MSTRAATTTQAAPGLDRRTELSKFLRSRRARLKPEDVGLPSHGRRRVPGLRREELAQLAGVSFAYYVRLEQGYSDGVSAEVLHAVARVLRLSGPERAHLMRLAQPERQQTAHPAPRQRLRPAVEHLLNALGVPAIVAGRRMDILGGNQLAATVFGNWTPLPPEERSLPRLFFLSPTARERFADPARTAPAVVGILRLHIGKHPDDPHLASLVGELTAKSEEFRRLWERHDVGCGNHDTIRMRHPLVGEYDLVPQPMTLDGDDDQRLLTYHAEPGSRSEEALQMLACWETQPVH